MGLTKEEKYVLYGGDVVLEFNEAEHIYRHKGRKVPSTTQITKVIEKSVLLYWAVKVQAEWLAGQWTTGTNYSSSDIEAILKRSKSQHKVKSEEATTIGSQVHFWIETFVNMSIETAEGTGWPEGWQNIPLPHTLQGIYSVNAFLNWFNDTDVVFLASERKVYSMEHGYSGTFDLMCMINGIVCLVDFKTSKAMYEDYYIQLSAYTKAYHEEIDYMLAKLEGDERTAYEIANPRIEEALVLRVPKDGGVYETGTVIVGSPMFDAYFEVFKASRVIYDWQEKYTTDWQKPAMKPQTARGKKKDINIYLPYIQ